MLYMNPHTFSKDLKTIQADTRYITRVNILLNEKLAKLIAKQMETASCFSISKNS